MFSFHSQEQLLIKPARCVSGQSVVQLKETNRHLVLIYFHLETRSSSRIFWCCNRSIKSTLKIIKLEKKWEKSNYIFTCTACYLFTSFAEYHWTQDCLFLVIYEQKVANVALKQVWRTTILQILNFNLFWGLKFKSSTLWTKIFVLYTLMKMTLCETTNLIANSRCTQQ